MPTDASQQPQARPVMNKHIAEQKARDMYAIGKLAPDDEVKGTDGVKVNVAVGLHPERRRVVLDFDECMWVGFSPEDAIELADLIKNRAHAMIGPI